MGNSIRLYGRSDGAPALIEAWREDGVPEVFPWPSPRAGDTAIFLAAWSEAPTGWGSRPLRLTLWRVRGRALSATWRSAEIYPHGLWASQLAVKGETVFIRYELRYPGWKPGCDVQSEQEDTYRVEPGTGRLRLVTRQLFNGWHRELQAAVTRFFASSYFSAQIFAEIARGSRPRDRLRRPQPGHAQGGAGRGERPRRERTTRAVDALVGPRRVRLAPERRRPRATIDHHG